MQLFFYLSTFSTPYMSHLLYLMFRCDFDVMENLEEFGEVNTAYVFFSELMQFVPDTTPAPVEVGQELGRSNREYK